jgi:Ran GTPase-activating protein (RanGAP) involved in mRNA processing and transport
MTPDGPTVREEFPTSCRVGPDFVPCDPAELTPLVRHLERGEETRGPVEFPRGTLLPDGRLDLCKQGVGPVQVRRVVQAAVGSPHAVHLLLGTNGLGADGARAVADSLTPGHRVSTVYLGCNRIDPAGAQALADRLATDTSVRALWLKRNPIGDDGLARLCDALAANATLRTLDLVNTAITVRGLQQLAATLAARPAKLERLFLGGNGLRPDAVPALTEIIHKGAVRELYLAANHLGDEGATAIGRAAQGQPMVLGLGGNAITPAGVVDLAGLLGRWVALDLARPPSERALGAHGNVVGDDGAAALADALPGSDLRRLDLRFTQITGRGVKRLLAAAQAGARLDYLGLSGGVPRRLKRVATASLGPAEPAPDDIRAIASVYR